MAQLDAMSNYHKRNKKNLRELLAASYTLGVNLQGKSAFRDSLRIINFILVVSGCISMYGHWCLFRRYFGDIPKIAETICTALQTIISLVKMVYFLFAQEKFSAMLYTATSHEILESSSIMKRGFSIEKKLRAHIEIVMNGVWRCARIQLVVYVSACLAIMMNYFSAILKNAYHEFKETPDYHFQLPYPAYYPNWDHFGMAFPYYHLQVYLESVSVYLSATCAVVFEGVFLVLCLHGVGLLRSLEAMMAHCTSPRLYKSERTEYLRCCIDHHQKTYEYIEQFRRLYKHWALSQFLLSLITMGIVLFQIALAAESDWGLLVRMIMYICAGGYQIIMYCINGQMLTTASETISFSFYNCAWYDESEEFKTLLRMMILRTNRHLDVNVSWFTTMSLPTCLALFQTSGSYFLLLRSFME